MKTAGIVALIFLISMVASALGPSLLAFIILPLFFVVLMIFPGKDPERPRLFKVIPWIWSLEFLATLVILISGFFGKTLFPEDSSTKPSQEGLWISIVFYGPLLWTFVKRHPAFRAVLVASTIAMLCVAFWDFSNSSRDINAYMELTGSVLAELMLTVYLLLKFKPQILQQ